MTKKYIILIIIIIFKSNYLMAAIELDKITIQIEESEHIGYLQLTNTDKYKAELIEITSVGEDVNVSILPAVLILEPGKKQSIKFIIKPSFYSTVQTLDTIIVKSATEGSNNKSNSIQVVLEQILPLIITPSTLVRVKNDWELLKYKVINNSQQSELVISNPTDFIIRIASAIKFMSDGEDVFIGQSIFLPQSERRIKLGNFKGSVKVEKLIELNPISISGSILPSKLVSYD